MKRNWILFLLLGLMNISLSFGQSCGFSFPADVPDKVCDTTRYLWLSHFSGSIPVEGQFSGPGVVSTSEGYFFSPALAGTIGMVTLKFQSSCEKETITITRNIEVVSCKSCNCFNVPFPQMPDTVCAFDDPVLLPDSGTYSGPGIVAINQQTYFDPSGIVTGSLAQETSVTIRYFAPGCENSTGVAKEVLILNTCIDTCIADEVEPNEMPGEVCADDSIYWLWDAGLGTPFIHIYGEGVFEYYGFIYFDPASISFDPGQTEKIASYTIEITGCNGEIKTETRQILVRKCCEEFEVPVLPDTVCVTYQSFPLPGEGYYQGPGLSYQNGTWWFDPSAVNIPQGNSDSTIIINYYISNPCDTGFFQSRITVRNCMPDTNDCPEVFFPDLPDTVCVSDTLIQLVSPSGHSFYAYGEGVVSNFHYAEFYFEADNVTFAPGQTEELVTVYYLAEVCGDSVGHTEQVLVQSCNQVCQVEFPELPRDSVCNDDPNYLLLYTPEDTVWSFTIQGEGVVRNNYGYYFNSSAITFSSGESGRFIDLFYTYEMCAEKPVTTRSIFVNNCSPTCDSMAFPGEIPSTVCSSDQPYLIADYQNTQISDFQIWGEGVISSDSGFYFDPSGFYHNDTVTIYFSGKSCGNYVYLSKSIIVTDCDSAESASALVYPNPVTAGTDIKVKDVQVDALKLFDLTGNVVKVSNFSRIETFGLSAGTYLLYIVDRNGLVLTQLVEIQ